MQILDLNRNSANVKFKDGSTLQISPRLARKIVRLKLSESDVRRRNEDNETRKSHGTQGKKRRY